MTHTIVPPEVYVKDTQTIKGRGVYSARAYKTGDIIETAPVIVLLAPYKTLPPRLKTRVFNWGDLTQSETPLSALVLGFGSLYNHANPANLSFKADDNNQAMIYTAAQNISKDDELTINYNGPDGHFCSERDDWFTKNNVTLEIPDT
jgi:SET domain-containing protein